MIKRKFGMYRLGYIPPIQSKYNVTLEQLNNVIEEWIKMDSSSNEKIRFFDKFGNQKSWSIEEEDGRVVCNNPDASLCIFETPFTANENKLYGVLKKKHGQDSDYFQWDKLTIDLMMVFVTHNGLPPISRKAAIDNISKLVSSDISLEAYNKVPKIKFFNGAGHEQFPNKEKVTFENAKFAVVYTNIFTSDKKQIIGWFTRKNGQPVMYNGITWGMNEDFKHAQDLREMTKMGRFVFSSVDERNNFLIDLAKRILPEPWEWKNEEPYINDDNEEEKENFTKNQRMPNVILANYLKYELDRLFDEADNSNQKIIYNKDKTKIYFNTNLIDIYGHDLLIVGYLDKSKTYIEKCVFNPQKRQLLSFGFDEDAKPEVPRFFNTLEEIFFYADKEIDTDYEHIITDRTFRFPLEYQQKSAQELTTLLEHSIDFAIEIAKRNYKFIIPTYYPKSRSIQFLMPIYLDTNKFTHTPPDMALVLNPVKNNNGDLIYYEAKTILDLHQVYIDARLIAKPYEPWLTKDVIKEL